MLNILGQIWVEKLDITVTNKIAKGRFASISRAWYHDALTGKLEHVALKEQDNWEDAMKERNMLMRLNPVHVVKIKYAFERLGKPIIAMELCRGKFK